MSVRVFEVGGCVRDEILGIPTKDVDFAVESGSYYEMEAWVEAQGFKVHKRHPEFQTIRAGVPKHHPLHARSADADFVMCRREAVYSDGRHPDSVSPGTIFDDLRRRDFTINAMAKDVETGEILDPHGGQEDIKRRIIRFVGDPRERIREDSLRILRGVRFSVTKCMALADARLFNASDLLEGLRAVSTDRIRKELHKMLAFSTVRSLIALEELPNLRDVIFDRPDLWLMPTEKSKKAPH